MVNAQSTAYYTITVLLDPQQEGGYTVTCEELPELITEGDSVDEALDNAVDAFVTTLKLYENLGRALPDSIRSIRKAKRQQMQADIRGFFETMNPKSQRGSGITPYCFKATLPTSDIGVQV